MSASYYDPVTGNQTSDETVDVNFTNECEFTNNHSISENSSISDNCSTSECNLTNDCNNNRLSILLQELYNDVNCQSVTMAALFNYIDDKNVKSFGKINLPEIKIKYDVLTKLFFSDVGKGFSSIFLNKLWKGITKFSLADKVQTHYEKLTGNDRSSIPSLNKVKMYKECAIDKIASVANRSFGLNLQEFNCALGSVDVREDKSICSIIPIHLYFESIGVGLIIIMKFAIYDTPEHLIGKISSNDNIVDASFDFTNLVSQNTSCVEIVFDTTK